MYIIYYCEYCDVGYRNRGAHMCFHGFKNPPLQCNLMVNFVQYCTSVQPVTHLSPCFYFKINYVSPSQGRVTCYDM